MEVCVCGWRCVGVACMGGGVCMWVEVCVCVCVEVCGGCMGGGVGMGEGVWGCMEECSCGWRCVEVAWVEVCGWVEGWRGCMGGGCMGRGVCISCGWRCVVLHVYACRCGGVYVGGCMGWRVVCGWRLHGWRIVWVAW